MSFHPPSSSLLAICIFPGTDLLGAVLVEMLRKDTA